MTREEFIELYMEMLEADPVLSKHYSSSKTRQTLDDGVAELIYEDLLKDGVFGYYDSGSKTVSFDETLKGTGEKGITAHEGSHIIAKGLYGQLGRGMSEGAAVYFHNRLTDYDRIREADIDGLSVKTNADGRICNGDKYIL